MLQNQEEQFGLLSNRTQTAICITTAFPSIVVGAIAV